MERGLIRKRWQVTLPREIRRRLNLFIGQTLNFTLDEDYCIRISTGIVPSAEEAEFYEQVKGKKAAFGKRRKFRISEGKRTAKRERPKEARFEKLEEMASFFPRDPEIHQAIERAEAAEDAREGLKQLVANLSRFLLSMQERL
jgi:bifunctional DNA-binding transcriptional regulator/antitoxin component of YhaV-PrlF toxin-antitoxin module